MTAGRVGFGMLCAIGGTLWAVLDPPDATHVVVGLVFAAGGLVIVTPLRRRLPRRLTGLAMVLAAAAGTAGGTAVEHTSLGGMFVWSMARGWPFGWLTRDGIAGDAETAYRIALADTWSIGATSLLATLAFWSMAAMVLTLAGTLTRQAWPR